MLLRERMKSEAGGKGEKHLVWFHVEIEIPENYFNDIRFFTGKKVRSSVTKLGLEVVRGTTLASIHSKWQPPLGLTRKAIESSGDCSPMEDTLPILGTSHCQTGMWDKH
jgi:hypothetical protein